MGLSTKTDDTDIQVNGFMFKPEARFDILIRMSRQPYSWSRYWISTQGTIVLDEDFLADPEALRRELHSPPPRPTPSLAELPGAALLAEPALGKSTELDHLEDECLSRDGRVVLHNLAAFTGTQDIQTKLLDAPEFKAWELAGPGEDLTLLLDGLDEFSALCSNAGTALAQALKSLLGQSELADAEYADLCSAHTGLENLLAGLVQRRPWSAP